MKINLTHFLNNKPDENLFKGNIKSASNSISFLENQSEIVNDWLLEKNLLQLGKYWCYGLTLDWSSMFNENSRKKISLPTYPFAKDKYWIELKKKTGIDSSKLHPLLHQNVSDLNEQKFITTFTGKEFFLADHIVGVEKILPGVAQIEMIREAGERSIHMPVTSIKNLSWIRPIRVREKPINVFISLSPSDEDVDFKIYTQENGSEIIYSRGKLNTNNIKINIKYDISALIERLSSVKNKETCYSLLKEKELNLGESYKGVKRIYYDSNEALSEIELPKEEGFVFTPGILDSCLQSCLLWFLFRENQGLALPYSVKEIFIYGTLSKKLWCYSRKNRNKEHENQLEKYDIDILNEEGEVVISIKEFFFFPLNELSKSIGVKAKKPFPSVHLFNTTWKVSTEVASSQYIPFRTILYIIEGSEELAFSLSKKLNIEVKTFLGENRKDYFVNIFNQVQQLAKEKEFINILVLYENKEFYNYAFISGLLKTLHQENNKIFGKIIGIDSLNNDQIEQLVQNIKTEIMSNENEVCYIENVRNVKTYQLIENFPTILAPIIKKGGLYIITGGVGGLGLIFAKYINEIDDTKIILIGRSELSESKKKLVSELSNASYYKVDVNDKDEVISFIKKVKAENKEINGIIHSAGVIRDSLIINKTESEIIEVLNPKIEGVKNLDIATQNENLDFMVFFSSIAAVFGNIGQSDYASANSYLDYYAQYREKLKEEGRRKGKTVSINWSFWDEGGMQVDTLGKKYFENKWQMLPLPTQETIKTFEQLLNSNITQGIIACGEKQQINKALIESTIRQAGTIANSYKDFEKTSDLNQLTENVTQKIREYASILLKLDVQKILNNVEWGEFGFDSVVLTDFSSKINLYYNLDINPTIFYNYPTINFLVEHLINEYGDQIKSQNLQTSRKTFETNTQRISFHAQNAGNENSIISASNLKEEVTQKIIEFSSILLKLDSKNIKKDVEWGEYGFDSVILTDFSNKLNTFYGIDITPTVFYNYITISDLVDHLNDEYADRLQNKHKKTSSEDRINEFQIQQPLSIRTKRSAQIFTPYVSINQPISEISKNFLEPVAIIGISGRLPGSSSLDEFWENIRDKKDLITEVPPDRWDWKKYYGDPKTSTTKTKAKWGGFIKDIDKFDSLYFNISPREAQLMDPQQRITLEAVFSALEDAGVASNKIKGSDTGVFIGVASSDYSVLLNQEPFSNEAEFSTGEAHSVLANRISYLLDIHGPSQPIDTACSSSLIAIHRAVENIRNGNCKIAIAGGVNAIITPQRTLSFSQAGMLSEDGRCKTFDQSANGYVRGEGVGIVILKSLQQAEADGDQIYAIIRATAENHGGKANTLTSPNPIAQKELLVKAYKDANIDPREVSYIEAHGTGTPLGDPIEIEGLKSAFSQLYKERELPKAEVPYCAIGSVKTNIGHLEAAAGIAGVLKIVYAIKHKTLPGNPNLTQANEYLKLNDTPFYLLKDTIPWQSVEDKPRIAGVSSFGFGGANAHVIMQEYKTKSIRSFTYESPAIIVLSAKDKDRLNEQVINLKKHIEENPALDLYDIAYTLQEGRNEMEERLALIASSKEEVIQKLTHYLEGKTDSIFYGNIKKKKSDFLLEGGAGKAYIQYAIENKESQSLAQLWVQGIEIEWKLLYFNNQPNKISLPTYSFLKERHWIKENSISLKERDSVTKLHPLLHWNDSNFEEQKFVSIYTGNEFFLRDHIVNQTKVLPGVAYLELVREAITQSTDKKINQIKNITWLNPIKITSGDKKINIKIYMNDEGFDFEVCSTENDDLMHSTGEVRSVILTPIDKTDVSIVKARCTKNIEEKYFYKEVEKAGVSLGNSFRGIRNLYYNEFEALSQIELDTEKDFILSPGILDSAIQTYVGVDMNNSERTTGLPYRIKEVNIYHSLKNISKCWAYVKKRTSSKKDGAPHFDVNLLDFDGNILIQFVDLIIVTINKPEAYQLQDKEPEILSLYSSKWITQQI